MLVNGIDYDYEGETNGIEEYKNEDVTYYLSGNIISKHRDKLVQLKRMGMNAPIYNMIQSGALQNCKEFGIKELV